MSFKLCFGAVFLVVAALQVTGNPLDCPVFKPVTDKCLKEVGLTKADMESFLEKRPIQTDDKNIKCFFKCILVESNWMDSAGMIMEKPPNVPEEFAASVSACHSVPGIDMCDKGFNFHVCISDKMEAK